MNASEIHDRLDELACDNERLQSDYESARAQADWADGVIDSIARIVGDPGLPNNIMLERIRVLLGVETPHDINTHTT